MKNLFFTVMLFFIFYVSSFSQAWFELDTMYAENGYRLDVLSVKCLDDSTCLAITSYAVNGLCILKRTSNGGRTWENVYYDTTSPIRMYRYMSLFSKNLSYIEANPGLIIKSTDAGKTWEKIFMDKDSTYFGSFTDERYGTRQSFYKRDYDHYRAEYTKDGGNSWHEIQIPEEYKKYEYYGATMFHENLFIIRFSTYDLSEQYFVRVEDSLRKWTAYKCPAYLWHYQVLDSNHIWATGLSERKREIIYFSGDGCKTWKTLIDTNDGGRQFRRIAFADENNGFAYGPYFVLSRTTDGGLTWFKDEVKGYPTEQQGRIVYPGFKTITFPTPRTAMAVTDFPINVLFRFSMDYTSVLESYEPELSLLQYPNPFSELLITNYELLIPSNVTMKIYDALGIEVAMPVNEYQDAGEHQAVFDGSSLAQGIYYYTIQIGGSIKSGKMILVR